MENSTQQNPESPVSHRGFWVSIVIIVLLLILASIFHSRLTQYGDVMQTASTTSAEDQALQQTGTTTNALYTYRLPSGWQYVPNTGQGEQAVDKSADYVFSVVTIPLSATITSTTSIDQILPPAGISQIIQSEFSSTTIADISVGLIGGEKAIITKFSGTATEVASSGSEEQSARLSMLQYNALHEGVLFTVILIKKPITPDATPADFQTIINSFVFKK